MSLSGKTVFITGATGFLGGAIALRLADEGARVKALVRSPQKAKFLQNRPEIEIVQGDVTNPTSFRDALNGVDIVIHSAALFDTPDGQQAVNVEGTRNVAQAAADAGVSRFVHISTIAVYGYGKRTDVDETRGLTPSQADTYSRTKAEDERVLLDIARRTGMAYSIIRPGMIYGPRSYPWTYQMMKLGGRSPIFFIGNGGGSAHPIYLDDVVDLTLTLATHPAAVGEAFNCTPDPAPTTREFLTAYQRLAGKSGWIGLPPLLVIPIAKLISAFAPSSARAKDAASVLDMLLSRFSYRMDKARKLLGWSPKVTLEEGIQRCAPWLREKGLL